MRKFTYKSLEKIKRKSPCTNLASRRGDLTVARGSLERLYLIKDDEIDALNMN